MADLPGAGLPSGLAAAWGARPGRRRGPKPAFTVERIVAVAIELADAGGYPALTLPRIAARLGVTTNAVYRYVTGRDELLVLVLDAAWGPPPPAIRRARSWRGAARAWTLALIERVGAHPWLLEVPVRGAPQTPNLLAWLEALLQGMRPSGLPVEAVLGCGVLLDGYARSTARLMSDLAASADPPVEAAAVAEFLLPRLAAAGLPTIAEMMTAGGYRSEAVDPEWGLARILDGIQQLIDDRRGPQRGGRRRASGS